MILVRCSPHENGVFTFIDSEAQVVQKSSYAPAAIENLKREYEGYQWYFKRVEGELRSHLSFEERPRAAYARLRIPYLDGCSGNYNKSLAQNFSDLERIIRHYFQTWPQVHGGLVPLHGDFSIGNVIFQHDHVFVIDWEHYHPNAAPYGLDLANLLYESVFFSLKRKNQFSAKDQAAFLRLRHLILGRLPQSGDFDFSLSGLQTFISENVSFWGPIVKKLPAMKFTTEQKAYLAEVEKITI